MTNQLSKLDDILGLETPASRETIVDYVANSIGQRDQTTDLRLDNTPPKSSIKKTQESARKSTNYVGNI